MPDARDAAQGHTRDAELAQSADALLPEVKDDSRRYTLLGVGESRVSLTCEYVTDPGMPLRLRVFSNLKRAFGYCGFGQLFRGRAQRPFAESRTMFLRWTSLCALLVASLVALASGGCASLPPGGVADDTQNDPLEPLNRRVFAVNQAVDRTVIKPVAKAYRSALPEVVRDRVRSFIDNLTEPLTFANDLLQGRGEAAGITGRRFIINSTWGIGGLFDKAAEVGMQQQSGDFGQTLYAWGVGDGPFLMLPLFGPTNLRDALGTGVDAYASPFGRIGSTSTRREVSGAVGVTDGIDLRSRNIETLETIEANAIDFYAYLRSVWRQNRQATLREAREGAPDDELTDPGAVTRPAPAAPPSR